MCKKCSVNIDLKWKFYILSKQYCFIVILHNTRIPRPSANNIGQNFTFFFFALQSTVLSRKKSISIKYYYSVRVLYVNFEYISVSTDKKFFNIRLIVATGAEFCVKTS